MSSSADQILLLLKSRGAQRTSALASALQVTPTGARQLLASLHAAGLVCYEVRPGGVGRPMREWRLTDKAHARFPDRHADLTLSLIEATRSVFGHAALDQLIAEHGRALRARYAQQLLKASSLGAKVRELARLRSSEGYMARVRRQRDGSWLLTEDHCPIRAAAKSCQGFCRSELTAFCGVLGAGAQVERVEHQLAGARRCAYRISIKQTT